MKITENVPISTLTTMRLGGPARYVIEIEHPSDVHNAYDFAKDHHLPIFILGGGANTLGHDEGFPGIIIINRMRGIEILSETEDPGSGSAGGQNSFVEDHKLGRAPLSVSEAKESDRHMTALKIMGGEPWDNVVAYTCKRNFTGIEALSKIPGLTGAAPVQNIGAYGQEIADTFISAEVYDAKDNQTKTLTKSDFSFAYRRSILNTTAKNRYFVISITLTLKKGSASRPFYSSIEKYISDHHHTDLSPQGIREIVSAIRTDKLPDPLEKASAGSFFKNIYLTPDEATTAEAKNYPVYHGHGGPKINSAWLIEQAGLKGELLHGIRVSDKAPLVLINESAKSYADLAKARTEIIERVKTKFGYTLQQEPVEIIP